MGAVKKTDRPVFFPGLTAWRSGQGPVLDFGEIVAGDPERGVQGYRLYLNERELREAVIAWGPELLQSLATVVKTWGWVSPDEYDEMLDAWTKETGQLADRIAELEAELERSKTERVQVVSLADALAASKPKPRTKTAA